MIKKLIILIICIYSVKLYANNISELHKTIKQYKEVNKYKIEYKGIKIGEIKDFDSLNEGFIKIKTNSFFVKLINKNNKYLIYHNKDIEKKENTTYKKDESDLIKILKSIIEEPKSKIFNISNNRILVLNCNNQEVCNYTISNSKNKIYRYGEVIIKDNELKRYEDFTKKVKIESMSFANLNYKLN